MKVEHINEASFPETVSTRGEYEYNALFQRVIKRSDKDITDGTLGIDEQRLLYYSGAWQIVEEHIDDGYTGSQQLNPDRIVQHVWGLRYIDDLVLNRQDSNADGDYVDAGDFTHYALTDHQFSVVALIDSAGNLIERVSYTPYGEARHHWRQDVDGDGDIDATDQSIVSNAQGKRIYESGYNVDADFDRNGIIDSNDSRQIGAGAFRAALPAGWISSLSAGNVIGFSGYVFNREIDAGGLYTVRFRHYDPVWGRWTSRDPAGYADSMSLYGYGWGYPVGGSDPLGDDYYEWEDHRGWKNGRRGTYHHQYRYVWHWYGLYYTREYVGSTFTEDGDYTDDRGLSDYQRRVLQALNEAAGRTGDVVGTGVAAAAIILIVALPGPEDFLIVLANGVRLARIGGKWFRMLDDGTKVAIDAADEYGDWVWKGKGPPGSRQGQWVNKKTGETIHPDLDHPGHGPHIDYEDADGNAFRIYPDGRCEPK